VVVAIASGSSFFFSEWVLSMTVSAHRVPFLTKGFSKPCTVWLINCFVLITAFSFVSSIVESLEYLVFSLLSEP